MPKRKGSSANEPLVSFLLPVYNCESFLTETLHSILEQTYTNFEVIAINDGSKDNSLAILNKYAAFDERIRVVSRENHGLVATLNEAIGLAKGDLLARIDGDDLCVPKRIEWQVAEMQKNKNAALCYGFFELLSEDGEFLGKTIRPAHGEDIKRMLYVGNAIAHASVMIRKSLLPQQLYRDDVGPTEDYELWTRLAIDNDFVCVPRIIMRYRVNTSGIMHTIGHQQWEHMRRNTGAYWEMMGPPAVLSPQEIRRRMSSYIQENDLTGFGAEILRVMLDGESQLAMKCIRRGYTGRGIKILLATAFSSRTGMRVCRRRIWGIVRGSLSAGVSALKPRRVTV
jgi:glycosyltransferase involved in cell wall biosynthesis